jgi:DNA replication and repair protein RecF
VLDDVFAELDGSRRDRLADAVADYEQVLITAAVEGDVPDRLKAHTVRIAAGTIVEQPEAPVDTPAPASIPDAASGDTPDDGVEGPA